MGTWTLLEHTADLALEARGASPEEALEALCLGLAAQVSDPAGVEPREAVELEAEGLDAPETLVSALGEVLYWLNVRGWVFASFRASLVTERRIRLVARGEPRDPGRHPFEVEVKAATYHDLRFGPDADRGGWLARVVFDV